MIKIIDLSRPLREGNDQPIGHPPTVFEDFQTHETHGRTNTTIKSSIHAGTHVDSPYHFIKEGKTIDEMDINSFFGEGVYVDVSKQLDSNRGVTVDDILNGALMNRIVLKEMDLTAKIVVIHTGWGEQYGQEVYYKNNPYISNELAEWFVRNKIKAIALDFPPDKSGGSDVHKILLGSDIIIIENITNLKKLKDIDFVLFALPICMQKQGGAPSRVVAMIRGESDD